MTAAGSPAAFGATPPSSSLTPGAVDPHVTQDTIVKRICTHRGTVSVRRVSTRTRNKVYAEYQVKRSDRSRYVIDHLVPLELGGASALPNLWPERKTEAKAKAKVEGTIRARLCAGHVDLATAQRAFETGWRTATFNATTTTTTSTTTSTTTTTTAPVTVAPEAGDDQSPAVTTQPAHSPY